MFVTCFQMYLQTGVKEVLCLPSLLAYLERRKPLLSQSQFIVFQFTIDQIYPHGLRGFEGDGEGKKYELLDILLNISDILLCLCC